MTEEFFNVLLINNKDEVTKIIRLAEFLCIFAQELKRPLTRIRHMICWLEDQKGELTITFNTRPNARVMEIAKKAWEQCKEHEIVFQYLEKTTSVVKVEAENGTT